MAKNSRGVKIEFKPSVILILLSSLTLFVIIMLQSSCCFNNKLLYNFFGQPWTTTWLMSFILLLIISALFFKARLLKMLFGFIIVLAIIASAVGLVFESNLSSITNNHFVTDLKFSWDNSLIPTLIAYDISFIGSILWISNL